MTQIRVYSLYSGIGRDKILIKFGLSRFGNKPDSEMENLISKDQVYGKQSFYIEWTPEKSKHVSIQAMQSMRIKNMKKRIEKKYPLFADEMIKKEMQRDKFNLASIQKDLDIKIEHDEQWIKEWWIDHPESKQIKLAPEHQGE